MNYKQLDPLKLGWICLFGLATSISLKSHPQLDSDHWQIQTRIFSVLLNNKEKHVKFSCIICYLDRQISFSCINYFPRLLSSIRNLRTCDTGETFFFFFNENYPLIWLCYRFQFNQGARIWPRRETFKESIFLCTDIAMIPSYSRFLTNKLSTFDKR